MSPSLSPRSWLFVPGDSERKLAKIADSDADAVIIDLEDAVAPERRAAALDMTCGLLRDRAAVGQGGPALWVRLNVADGLLDDVELTAIAACRPTGVMVPKARDAAVMRRIAEQIDAAEVADGGHTIATFPVATETPAAVFGLASYADGPVARLGALTWGAEDLGAVLGVAGNRGDDGRFREPFRVVRALALLAAKAAGVQAVETLHADFRDLDGLEASSRMAAAEGFTGRLAIHPAQVAVINRAFVPTAAQIDRAEAIVAAFASAGTGTASLDGAMLDRPHRIAAETLLARAKAYGAA